LTHITADKLTPQKLYSWTIIISVSRLDFWNLECSLQVLNDLPTKRISF